jgi:epoxyqueuosine reductase
MLENARSVVVIALAYNRDEPGTGMRGARIARYARGRDYHNFFRKALRGLAAWLRARAPGHEVRPVVDTAPVLERAWAARAGVGFVGKNGCVIAPGLGSFVLLGELITTLELPADAPLSPRCGSCTLCLDACPTRAFAAPYVLDARRCVSYLTIEHEGAMDTALRSGVGDWLFGCDVCQDVCPYNRTAPPDPRTTEPFATDPWRASLMPEDLLTLPPDEVDARVRGTPLARPGAALLARNAAVVLGNTGSKRHLPVLQTTASQHSHSSVREAAQWAVNQIQQRDET